MLYIITLQNYCITYKIQGIINIVIVIIIKNILIKID